MSTKGKNRSEFGCRVNAADELSLEKAIKTFQVGSSSNVSNINSNSSFSCGRESNAPIMTSFQFSAKVFHQKQYFWIALQPQ